jgi:hypothetical protein
MMSAGEQSSGPPAKSCVALGDMRQGCARSMDQQFAEVLVASLADTEKPRFAASRGLIGNKTQPSREIATVFESFRIPYGRDQRRGNRDADARYLHQSPRVSLCERHKLGVKPGDPPIELHPLRTHVGNERAHS